MSGVHVLWFTIHSCNWHKQAAFLEFSNMQWLYEPSTADPSRLGCPFSPATSAAPTSLALLAQLQPQVMPSSCLNGTWVRCLWICTWTIQVSSPGLPDPQAVWLLILLGWVFLPVYIGSGVSGWYPCLCPPLKLFLINGVDLPLIHQIYTMPEYLQWRFGGYRLRIYLTVIALVTYIFSTVSVSSNSKYFFPWRSLLPDSLESLPQLCPLPPQTDLFSGAMFIRQTFGINIYIGVAVILVVSAVFSALGEPSLNLASKGSFQTFCSCQSDCLAFLGGLHTVVFTDAVAVVVMVLGGVLMSILGNSSVGKMSKNKSRNLSYLWLGELLHLPFPAD